MIIEDKDYVLARGRRWWPFGRVYRLLRDVGQIKAGREWDGASFLPMRRNSPLMHGVLIHDWHFSRKIADVDRADRDMLLAWEQDGVPRWKISAAEMLLWWFRPTTDFTWATKGTSWPQAAVALINLPAPPLARLIVNWSVK